MNNYLIVGEGLMWQGRHKEALGLLNKALKLEPTNSLAYSDKAYTYFRMENYQEALIYYNRAIMCFKEGIKDHGTLDFLYWQRGETLFYQGRYIEAVESFRKMFNLMKRQYESNYEDTVNIVIGIAEQMFDMGYYSEALEIFNMALEVDCEPDCNIKDLRNKTLSALEGKDKEG